MKVLNVFWNLDIMDRYVPQFKAIADKVDSMTILYSKGNPKEEWKEYFDFKFFLLTNNYTRINSLRMLMGMYTVADFINAREFDLIYCLSGVWLQAWSLKIAQDHHKPLVIRMRGDPVEVREFMRTPIQAFLSKRILEPSFREATRVVPIVEKFVPRLKTLGVKDIKISEAVPNGVNHRKFKWTLPGTGEFNPAYIGRVSPEKGSQFLLKLMKECDYKFNIAGEIQDKKFVPTSNCHYLGKIPYDYIQDVYQMSSVILLPSHYEGLSNILPEAYASGRPVIMSHEAIPKEIEIHGYKLDRDIENWKRALNDLREWGLREMIGKQAYEYSKKKFSWNNYGDRMKEEFEKALKDYYD